VVHVPYRSAGSALTDLLGGQVQITFPSVDRVPCANNEQRVAVGRGTHDRLGADIAAGGTVLALSPGDFGRLIAEETGKWGKVTRASNIKTD
jgi:hypothetical protein